MQHVMLDLETLGTRPGCAILSIGAVKFDPELPTAAVDRENGFYRVIALQSAMAAGLRIQADTLYWWLGQSDEARKALIKDPKPLGEVLTEFDKWFEGSTYVWGHGASFDPPVLEAAYAALKRYTPWDFRNIRDTRTIYNFYRRKLPREEEKKHQALDDAIHQARELVASIRSLKKKLDA